MRAASCATTTWPGPPSWRPPGAPNRPRRCGRYGRTRPARGNGPARPPATWPGSTACWTGPAADELLGAVPRPAGGGDHGVRGTAGTAAPRSGRPAPRRTVAGRVRRAGKGRQVDPAQRPRRAEDRGDRRGRVYEGGDVVRVRSAGPGDGVPALRYPAAAAPAPAGRRRRPGPRRPALQRPRPAARRPAERVAHPDDPRRHTRHGLAVGVAGPAGAGLPGERAR